MENMRTQIDANVQTDENAIIKKISASPGNENSFDEIAVKWLDQIRSTRKYSTYIKYLRLYEFHMRDVLMQAKISDISNAYINEKLFNTEMRKNVSANTRHSIIVVINQILQYANEYCRI